MRSMWQALEERTRAWDAMRRQGLAEAVWADYVTVRFLGTGDPRALEYLYPYLNDADEGTREKALRVASRVFEGCGAEALGELDYFLRSHRPWLRDRAVRLVGAAMRGATPEAALCVLEPYLTHRNLFIRKQALRALGRALDGRADGAALEALRRTATTPGVQPSELSEAVAVAFSGHPTEETWRMVREGASPAGPEGDGHEQWLAVLARGAGPEWSERLWVEELQPWLDELAGKVVRYCTRNGVAQPTKTCCFERRSIAVAWCKAHPRQGVSAAGRIWPLRAEGTPSHAMMSYLQHVFGGADPLQSRERTMELASGGDAVGQRLAAVCLGRLVSGDGDEETIEFLRDLAERATPAARAGALAGLGMAARATCDDALLPLLLQHAGEPETAGCALRATGMVYLGSGRANVFRRLRELADVARACGSLRALEACYTAVGFLYLGTGSLEPVGFLLEAVDAPRASRVREAAARSLVAVEFGEFALGRTVDPCPYYPDPCRYVMCSPWPGLPGA